MKTFLRLVTATFVFLLLIVRVTSPAAAEEISLTYAEQVHGGVVGAVTFETTGYMFTAFGEGTVVETSFFLGGGGPFANGGIGMCSGLCTSRAELSWDTSSIPDEARIDSVNLRIFVLEEFLDPMAVDIGPLDTYSDEWDPAWEDFYDHIGSISTIYVNDSLDFNSTGLKDISLGGTAAEDLTISLQNDEFGIWMRSPEAESANDWAKVFYCSMVGSLCAGGYTGGDTTYNGANLDITYTLPGYIENLPSSLEAVRFDDPSVNVESGNSGQFDSQSIVLMTNGYHIGIIDVDFGENRDWSTVHGEIDPISRRTVLSGIASAPGTVSSLSLLVPKDPEDTRVGICPNATFLEDVNKNCTGLEMMDEADTRVSITNIGENTYWIISGLTGTGGFSSRETPAETGSPLPFSILTGMTLLATAFLVSVWVSEEKYK
jgi:hypothetical protein